MRKGFLYEPLVLKRAFATVWIYSYLEQPVECLSVVLVDKKDRRDGKCFFQTQW